MMIVWPNWQFLMLSGTNDVGEKYHDNILWPCVQWWGGGQLVQWFPKDNCKPDIWCRKVPFICAGVMEVGGDDAQVPLWWSQTQYFSRMSSLFSRNSPPPPQFWALYFVVTISITSQQNVCEEMKIIEQFQLFIFGTEVLISLLSSLGGWWGCGWVVSLAKGTTSRTLVFLISDKKKEPPS